MMWGHDVPWVTDLPILLLALQLILFATRWASANIAKAQAAAASAEDQRAQAVAARAVKAVRSLGAGAAAPVLAHARALTPSRARPAADTSHHKLQLQFQRQPRDRRSAAAFHHRHVLSGVHGCGGRPPPAA